MIEALGTGWLVALVLGVPSFATALLVPFGRWLAATWRRPLEEEVKYARETKARLEETLEKLSDARLQVVFLEAKLKACESELENWKSGRWTSR